MKNILNFKYLNTIHKNRVQDTTLNLYSYIKWSCYIKKLRRHEKAKEIFSEVFREDF